LRKSQRSTLEAIRELMRQHVDPEHPYWETYYRDNLAATKPENRAEEEAKYRVFQDWSLKAMSQLIEAIDQRLEMEDAASRSNLPTSSNTTLACNPPTDLKTPSIRF